jgi:hypothetical protein
MLELFSANALDKGNLVLYRLKLSQSFVIVQQSHISGWEFSLLEHLGNFFALERGSAHNRNPVKAR